MELVSAGRANGHGNTKAVLLGLLGLAALAASAGAVAYFTRPSDAARARAHADASAAPAEVPNADKPARERELAELRRRVADLESAALTEKEGTTPDPSASTRPTRREPETPEEMQPRVLQTIAEMDGRFSSQGARSDWSVKKEQELRAGMSSLGEDQRGRVLSLDCREEMCRMEVEYESGRQAMAFLDAIGSDGGFGDARSTRLRPKLGDERYVFYIEPRGQSSRVTITQ